MFVYDLQTLNALTLPLKASVRNSVLLYLSSVDTNSTNAVDSEVNSVYGQMFQRQTTEVTAAWRKVYNSSLPPIGWFKVTCGLTACTLGSAPGPTLSNEYGKT